MTDDGVRQMLLLAERIREQHGGELDDAAILAVSEATGATPEYVRLAVRLLPEKKTGVTQRIKGTFLTLEPDVRRHVSSGLLATICALCTVVARGLDDAGQNLVTTLMLIVLGLSVWNVGVSKDTRVAAVSGALFGGIFFVAESLFTLVGHLLRAPVGSGLNSALLIFFIVGGGLIGMIAQRIVSQMQRKIGIKDPVQERQELLRQLVNLQDKLRSGEQRVTFLCVDIVGSTKMKAKADPLSVEFTFTEYHQFVENVVKRYGGSVHSTAGDGVTCAFDFPQQAFGAARNMQTGLVELNTYRNKIGVPIVLRAGIHTGIVNAPTDDIKTVNFAHVIDVASHLQRACPPGGVVISEEAAGMLPGGGSSVGQERVETEDCIAFVWQPRQKLVSLDAATPPPAPQV